MSTKVNSALNDLKGIIPYQIIDKSAEDACSIITLCLLKDFIKSKTNIGALIGEVKAGCPMLVDSFSNITVSTLTNLNDPANQMAFTNLIMASIISIASLTAIVKTLDIKTDDSTIYDASFLILVSVLLITLIEKSDGFKDYIKDEGNCNILFSVLSLLEVSYISFLSSTHLIEEIKSILDKIGDKSFDSFDKCCGCTYNPFKDSKPNKVLTPNEVNEKVSLRTAAFSNAVHIANLK
jgi:hypothetical protein